MRATSVWAWPQVGVLVGRLALEVISERLVMVVEEVRQPKHVVVLACGCAKAAKADPPGRLCGCQHLPEPPQLGQPVRPVVLEEKLVLPKDTCRVLPVLQQAQA